MVARRPVVVISGQRTELPPGDNIAGVTAGTLTAGSGLDGGGSLSNTTVTNVSLAPNASGLIFVDNKYLALDGAAQRTAATAISSGNYALSVSPVALASGLAGSSLAATALASGNAALSAISAKGGGVIQSFTAASAVASGYAVGLDGAGRVQSVRQSVDANTRSFGSSVVFESAATDYTSLTYDSTNNRVVIAYRDGGNSNYGTAIVGTVSGTSISFGTAVVFSSASTTWTSAVYDSTNNRVVIAYTNAGNTNFGTAVVGTVSGTSISFGTAVVFESGASTYISSAYDSTNNRVVIAYRNASNLNYGTAIVGTVSGTSISFGSAVVFQSASVEFISVAHDVTNNRVVIAYRNAGNSNFGTAIVGTVSGTSISFGTAVVFESSDSGFTSTVYDSTNNKIVIAYTTITILGLFSIVGTVSGTSISFGSAAGVTSAVGFYNSAVFDSNTSKIVLSYGNLNNSSYGTAIVGTVSGTSISFGTAVVFRAAGTQWISAVYDSTNNRVVIAYEDNGNSDFGTAVVGAVGSSLVPTISSQNNFIGIAQNTAASGSAIQVRLPGSYDKNNTGLTTGAVYYVNPTTSGFTTTATQPSAWSGAVNWGPVGRAVNSTTLLLTDMI
jgi:hypothetical protein